MSAATLWIWDATNEEWVKLAGTAAGAMSIHAIVEKLEDIEDVDLTGIADTYILYWDDASSTWKVMAVPSGAWADITGKPTAPSLEELATEHEDDGTHGDITPTSCTEKYTDAEAVTAMGVLGDANPLHHNRAAEWGAAEHTAIGDAAPHHTKYTDGEAKTQAEGAKLDDHAAPDDNTDLDAAAAQHGLMPKLDKSKLDDAASAATASKLVIRDASARAKFAAPGAAGDALIKGTRVTTAELPDMTDEKIWKGTGGNVEEVDVYTDAAAKAAAVQAGAITNAVTKAPTHDAVFDVKTTADGAIAKTLVTAQGDIITRDATVPKKLALGTEGHYLKAGASEPEWAAVDGEGVAFYSEANDLSDVTKTAVAYATIAAESYTTVFNIASGGCRFLGGVVGAGNVGYITKARVTVDGGAAQEVATTATNTDTIGKLPIPPIKADASLVIEIWNNDVSVRKASFISWHRAL